jgi:putative flavoprotein involved in K+ transport
MTMQQIDSPRSVHQTLAPKHAPARRYDVVVIGGGQAGLAAGYHLAARNLSFVILDGNDRIGDQWRARWDSLRLFTPARYDALPGMPFPAPAHTFPTKDAMADYLEAYAAHFALPVETGVTVDGLSARGDGFVVTSGERRYEADNVIVAMANYQRPRIPSFSRELRPDIVQLHSSEYRNPGQLRRGGVLVVGAGNSGSEIAIETARAHPTWLAGKHPGHLPFRTNGFAGRHLLVPLVLRFLFHRVMTVGTPLGRRVRPKVLGRAGPLIRVKPVDMSAAGIERVPRVVGVRDGLPLLADARVLEVDNVVWCTGFSADHSWIDVPGWNDLNADSPRGLVPDTPGLYFLGRHFLRALSSAMIHGAGRDAEHLADVIAARPSMTRQPQDERPRGAAVLASSEPGR